MNLEPNKIRTIVSVAAVFLCVAALGFGAIGSDSRRAAFEESGAALGASQDRDYSRFIHTSEKHLSLACSSCHRRATDNSSAPLFPGHKACTNCHLSEFLNNNGAICSICHSSLEGRNPPLKTSPASFNESFNVKFDHAQHLSPAVKPSAGCAACHQPMRRGVALSIPVGISAHTQCYTCHTPNSRSAAGKELASCGVCHELRAYRRTSTNARAFRYGFSHSKHGPAQRLTCTDCHSVTRGLPQMRQVSSPIAAEHFSSRTRSCLSCHNGGRAFGGDLAFRDCRRCHTGTTFRMPM